MKMPEEERDFVVRQMSPLHLQLSWLWSLFFMLHQRTSATLHPLRSYWIRKPHLEYLHEALSSPKLVELPESLQGPDP